MNGVAWTEDTLRMRDVFVGLAIVSHLFPSTECLAHKTLYERCGLFEDTLRMRGVSGGLAIVSHRS